MKREERNNGKGEIGYAYYRAKVTRICRVRLDASHDIGIFEVSCNANQSWLRELIVLIRAFRECILEAYIDEDIVDRFLSDQTNTPVLRAECELGAWID